MRRRFMLGAGLAAMLVVLVACGKGGSSSSSTNPTAAFKKSFGSAVNQLKQTSQAIGTAVGQASSQTDAQLGTTFQQLATQWQDQLSKLETLKPPSNLAVDFNTLTAAATRVETDLNAIVAAANTHSASAAEQASASLVTDITDAKSASAKITQALGAT